MLLWSHQAGSIPHPRGNPGAHSWSSGLPWHPWAEYLAKEKLLWRHTQVPGSIDPATPWLGQQLDVGTAISSLCEHYTHYSGTTLVCGSAPSTHPPGSASTSASLPSGSSKARGKWGVHQIQTTAQRQCPCVRAWLWKAEYALQLRGRDSGLHGAPGPKNELLLFQSLQNRDHSGSSQLQDPVGPEQLISKNQDPSLKSSMLDQQKLCDFVDFSTTDKKKCTDSGFFTLFSVGNCFKTELFSGL